MTLSNITPPYFFPSLIDHKNDILSVTCDYLRSAKIYGGNIETISLLVAIFLFDLDVPLDGKILEGVLVKSFALMSRERTKCFSLKYLVVSDDAKKRLKEHILIWRIRNSSLKGVRNFMNSCSITAPESSYSFNLDSHLGSHFTKYANLLLTKTTHSPNTFFFRDKKQTDDDYVEFVELSNKEFKKLCFGVSASEQKEEKLNDKIEVIDQKITNIQKDLKTSVSMNQQKNIQAKISSDVIFSLLGLAENWNEVSIVFMDREHVLISIKGKKVGAFHYSQLGFKKKRSFGEKDGRNKQWRFLLEMALRSEHDHEGVNLYDEKGKQKWTKFDASEARKRLKAFFGIQKNPIIYLTKNHLYTPKFKISIDLNNGQWNNDSDNHDNALDSDSHFFE